MSVLLQCPTAQTRDVVPASEIGQLYEVLSDRLAQIVRADVRAPEAVIEDACQFAWTRLIHHAGRVQRERALSWLARTAIREAFKLIRRERRELSLESETELAGDALSPSSTAGPDHILDARQRLESIRALPERQQRLVWLHALGLTYTEIATHAGCTPRTVERQLLRAKRTLRTIASA